ncbi:putative metal-dependent HD superfamily phosphohydrolase [Oceanihabitans sediminis]|uniref:HD domain-containing protein n=1 Tax=Oceanihabitans sediminis TaxID=1812012 RepID=A0A368P3I7_9FLAO|nr:Pycsar system effector family protein [Oceanihabitans sediminis]RBP33098.1 putative metal-dependent HD superfamily phosphohydrolase [Oceanihabitans sediminis]RCU57392.1 HD domain-containing protein [Oceanihabitans sediminis]
MNEELLLQVEIYVAELLSKQLSSLNYYHNAIHTRRVVSKVKELAKLDSCTEQEVLTLQVAAWFHDTGYIHLDSGHEEESVKIALSFLEKHAVAKESQDQIKQLILATNKDYIPSNKLECILKDADCGHLASSDYIEISDYLLKEINAKNQSEISDLEWMQENLKFLKNHTFYSNAAKQHWQPKKELNLIEIQNKIDKKISKEKKSKNSTKIGRGVETMFRVQLKNHIELSAIADTKANILLSVNAIIISVALSNLIPKLDNPSNMFLVYPTLVLMLFSVASVVLSVLSTRPKISNVAITKEMIRKKRTNILFFGNFQKMSLEDFEWGIDYLMENEDTLYNSLTKDLYYLGLVLNRKYKLLRITYTVFMFGIIISAAAFIFSYYVYFSA